MGDTEQAGGRKRNPWLAHVKKTMKANKGKSFKAVLAIAKRDYKAKKGGALSPADYSASSGQTAGRRHRGTRKTRKGGRKH